MKHVVTVNPFHCRMWEMHDRLEVTEASCKAEIESFMKHGQLIPVLGRQLTGDPAYKVELIYGARRLFVARHLNTPLQVELRDLTDLEAIVAMDIENRHRSDVSPYERGLSYARWIRAGHFRSQEEISRALRLSQSRVSRLFKLAQLPPVIVDAFDSHTSICEAWGLELARLLEDPQRRNSVISAARRIASRSPRPGASEVFRLLVSPTANGRRVRKPPHDEVVNGRDHSPLFRIRHESAAIAFVVPAQKVTPDVLENVRQAISRILQPAPAPVTISEVPAGSRQRERPVEQSAGVTSAESDAGHH